MNLAAVKIVSPPLFSSLKYPCNSIAAKSRRYSTEDRNFIATEVKRLHIEGIIELCFSLWRAQVLVTTNERHKKLMAIDSSQTINKFTNLDAYPLIRLDELINKNGSI